ncbi:uroporphyrinogen-III synthase [Calidifontibacter terrae]
MAIPDLAGQLTGARIVVTAQRRSAELGAALERRGARIDHAPALSVIPHVDDEALVAQTRALIQQPPDIVVVTTGVGFTGWMEAADAAGLSGPLTAVLGSARLIARGPKSRGAIQAAGFIPDWVAESETNAEVQEFLLSEGVAASRIAVQHHGSGADGIDEALAQAGADVVSLVVYRWGPAPDQRAVERAITTLARRECDAIVFTSAPGVVAFLAAAREADLEAECIAALRDPRGVVAAVVGDITAAPLRAVGVEPLVPDRFRLGALVRVLVVELAGRRSLAVATTAGELRVLRNAALLDGHPLALPPAGLIVLRLLAEAGGAVVTRDQILAALPGAGDAHAAEVAVARLRDAVPCRDLVTTVVKRGYRLAVAL